MRILQARATLGIVRGEIFPQNQTLTGAYTRIGSGAGGFFNSWNYGFNLNWELDFWGRFRRAIAEANDNLDASVEGYDFALVTLLADIAGAYVQIRNDQEQIRLTQENVALQRNIVDYLEKRAAAGFGTDVALNKEQGESVLAQTEAAIPLIEIDLRQNNDLLCVLLGLPAVDLREALPIWKSVDERKAAELEKVRNELQQLLTQLRPITAEDQQTMSHIVRSIYIPVAPAPKDAAIGIPADLLRQRPDVRQAERLAAAAGLRKLASPRPSSTRPSASTARWATKRHPSPACSPATRWTAISARRSTGICSTTAGSSTTCGSRTRGSRSWSTPTRTRCSRPTARWKMAW